MTDSDHHPQKPTHDVALALVARGDEWLVARRHADAHLGGLWEFPGGKQHPGEAAADAAVRELLEECGVRAVALRALPACVCEYEDRVVRLTPVLCRWTAGVPQALGNEVCRWAATAELAALEMPAVNAGIIGAALAARAELDCG